MIVYGDYQYGSFSCNILKIYGNMSTYQSKSFSVVLMAAYPNFQESPDRKYLWGLGTKQCSGLVGKAQETQMTDDM